MSEKSNIDQKIWTLKEAVYRFCDQVTVKALKDALKNPAEPTGKTVRNNPQRSKKVMRIAGFDLENNQSAWVTGKSKIPRNRIQTKRDLVNGYRRKLRKEFTQLLLAGEVIARAKESSPTAEIESLDASAWKYLKVSNRDETIAYVSAKLNNIRYYDLQFCLPQDAPLTDRSEPVSAPGDGKIGAVEFVNKQLTKFASDHGFNGDELARYFNKRGYKAEWIETHRQQDNIVFEASTIRKQLKDLLEDEKYLNSIGN